MNESENTSTRPKKPKFVTSLRHDENNLAKVAGFTDEAKHKAKATSGNEIDDWEFWRVQHQTRGQTEVKLARPLWISVIVLFCSIGILVPLWLVSQYDGTVTTMPLDDRARNNTINRHPTNGLTSEEIAQQFLDAETIEERLKWVRNAEKIAPLMRAYQTNHKKTEKVLNLRKFGHTVIQNGFLFEKFQVATQTGNRLLAVCETSDGRLVDWECYVRYNPLPWGRFLSQSPLKGSSEFRVFFSRTDFHQQLSPDADHTFYLVESPDLTRIVHGYVENDSPLANSLLRRSTAGRPPIESPTSKFIATGPDVVARHRQRAILSLRHVSMNNMGHIVEITGIKHLGWVTPE